MGDLKKEALLGTHKRCGLQTTNLKQNQTDMMITAKELYDEADRILKQTFPGNEVTEDMRKFTMLVYLEAYKATLKW